MTLRDALTIARRAIRANLLPGLLLQAIMVAFLSLYLLHDGTRHFLAGVADLKHQTGYWFAFVSYLISAALLPEILRVVFFQGGKATQSNLWNFLTAAPFWGLMGMLVDLFYRGQALWFGVGNDWLTILIKVLVDQLLFSPFLSNPLSVSYFSWRDVRFSVPGARSIFRRGFYFDRVFPVQVAGWCIWIPGVCLVYFMPPELQIPVATLLQSFWVLVFLLVNRPRLTRQG
ncbi:MAG: hypothetical protein ACOYMS_08310 [Terrimicrobiaceae bacterium]